MTTTAQRARFHVGYFSLSLAPAILFIVLRLFPAVDPSWPVPIFHFYIVSYTSLIAFVVALFVASGIGVRGGERALLVAVGFAAMAGTFLLHGLTTPNVLIGPNPVVGWAARLSLTLGVIFIAFAVRRTMLPGLGWLFDHPRRLWLVLAILYAALIAGAFGLPGPLTQLSSMALVSDGLALVTVLLFGWSTWRAWVLRGEEPGRVIPTLSVVLPWLALAQISQYSAPLWNASWWMYHALMLGGFTVAMAAIVLDYEEILNFRLRPYFAALTIIIGVPLVAVISEAAIALTGVESARWPVFGVSLGAVGLLFLTGMIIIARAQRVLDERKAAIEAEKQLRADLTNLIVHDLKNPLTVIQGGLDLMLSNMVTDISPEHKVRMARLRRSGTDMLRMINDLLDVERFEGGALTLAKEETDVPALLTECAASMQDAIESYDLKLATEFAAPLPPINLDSRLITRVVQNLIGNAIKFSPKGGMIRLTAEQYAGKVRVAVLDQGVGVPVQHRERIFRKFEQVEGGERRGAGLGLAFCRMAVEAHGGHIQAEEAPGGGSKFVFDLPVR